MQHGANIVHHSEEEVGKIIDVRGQHLEERVLLEILQRLLVVYLSQLDNCWIGSELNRVFELHLLVQSESGVNQHHP